MIRATAEFPQIHPPWQPSYDAIRVLVKQTLGLCPKPQQVAAYWLALQVKGVAVPSYAVKDKPLRGGFAVLDSYVLHCLK